MKIANEIRGNIIFDYSESLMEKNKRKEYTSMFYKIIDETIGLDYLLEYDYIAGNKIEDLIFMTGKNKETLIKNIEEIKNTIISNDECIGLRISFDFNEVTIDKTIHLVEGVKVQFIFEKNDISMKIISMGRTTEATEQKLDELNFDINFF